jgi:succinylglutamate desuccinylase
MARRAETHFLRENHARYRVPALISQQNNSWRAADCKSLHRLHGLACPRVGLVVDFHCSRETLSETLIGFFPAPSPPWRPKVFSFLRVFKSELVFKERTGTDTFNSLSASDIRVWTIERGYTSVRRPDAIP